MSTYVPLDDPLVLWDLVDFDGDCWLWRGYRNAKGYGHLRQYGYAHRLAWEMLRGPIPAGMTIDHLCRNTGCLRVVHMEIVTLGENVRRRNAARTHCPQGHEYTVANTYVHNGKRHCRVCRNERCYERDRKRAMVNLQRTLAAQF